MKKRMIAMLLCVLMALSSMGGAVFAAEEPVTAEEPIAEETVPPVDEFEVVDPHPLEGTVTEDVPEEAETPEIEETLPTEEPTAADPPAEEETEPEPTEDSMNSGVLDMEEEVIVGQISVPRITVTPGMTYEEIVTALKALPNYDDGVPYSPNCADVATTYSSYTVTISDPDAFSNEYKNFSPYYDNYDNLDLSQGQRKAFASVAGSQVGYGDGSHVDSLTGESCANDGVNYSEYGWFHGIPTGDWNAMFVSWCARKAGISTSIIPACTVTDLGGFGTIQTNYNSIREGDILYIFEGGDYRIGIVTDVAGQTIYTVEGQRNLNDFVDTDSYSFYDSRLCGYVAPDYSNWSCTRGNWYYVDDDTGEKETGWFTKSGYTYYLDPAESGKMVTGWKQVNGVWYYFRTEGNDYGPEGAMVYGWVFDNNKWYYLDRTTGAMVTGWRSIYSSSYGKYFDYHFEVPNGYMVTGMQAIDGETYYFRPEGNDNGPEGSRVTKWVSHNGYWYYMDPDNDGAMTTGWKTIYSAGKSGYYSAKDYDYYFKDSGEMAIGWQNVGTEWYYFRLADHANGPQGSQATGWIPSGDFWYYADPANDGAMVLGWKDINGERYYFSSEAANYGQMVTGTQVIDGVTYVFDDDGALIG